MKNKLETIQAAIDVWSFHLPELYQETPSCAGTLNPDEQARADRFIKKEQRDRFSLCRGLLRRILGDYLDQPPSELYFERNENGKPFLKDSNLHFNLSHSRDRMLIAVTAGRTVGVDIEFRRSGPPLAAIAQRWFSLEEFAFFQQLENPKDGFFDIWAKKEAYVKARGLGIFQNLSSFSVPLETTPDVPVIGNDKAWVFQTLEIDPAYAAAIVSEAPAVSVNLRCFNSDE